MIVLFDSPQAPEMVGNDVSYGRRVDTWGLGYILVQILLPNDNFHLYTENIQALSLANNEDTRRQDVESNVARTMDEIEVGK